MNPLDVETMNAIAIVFRIWNRSRNILKTTQINQQLNTKYSNMNITPIQSIYEDLFDYRLYFVTLKSRLYSLTLLARSSHGIDILPSWHRFDGGKDRIFCHIQDWHKQVYTGVKYNWLTQTFLKLSNLCVAISYIVY